MKPNVTDFQYHRAGWKTATHVMLKVDWPVMVYDWLEYQIKIKNDMTMPWIGFLHSPLHKETKEYSRYASSVQPIKEIVQNPLFEKNMKSCLGLYTLSRHTAEFLKRHVDVRVESLWHPVEEVKLKFNYKEWQDYKKIITIGQWMRRIHSICELNLSYKKIILSLQQYGIKDYGEMNNFTRNMHSVEIINYQNNDNYDMILSNHVVFLDLYDAAACNVVLECIVRNTPICINLLPAVVEYLGVNYPLYYQDIKEAEEKLSNVNLIQKATHYLTEMNKDHLSPGMFHNSINNSLIYQNCMRNKKIM